MTQLVKIESIGYITDDILKIIIEKPQEFHFLPGQAVNISINKEGWEDVIRTYAITSLPSDPYLEFHIKIYPEGIGGGFLQVLEALTEGDEIFVYDVVGSVTYKGEGVFIAGGVGVTPFISMLRQLEKDETIGSNRLIYASRKQTDFLFEEGLKELLGESFIGILSEEEVEGYEHGFVSEELIKAHLLDKPQYFYLCGPKPMTDAVEAHLENLGVPEEYIIIERF